MINAVPGYVFGWTYDNSSFLPAEPYMTCFWGNSTAVPNNSYFNLSSPLMALPNRIHDIPHNFSSAGDYLIQCNMSNFFSSQLLEHNVCKY
jgi:hypothetical protein